MTNNFGPAITLVAGTSLLIGWNIFSGGVWTALVTLFQIMESEQFPEFFSHDIELYKTWVSNITNHPKSTTAESDHSSQIQGPEQFDK